MACYKEALDAGRDVTLAKNMQCIFPIPPYKKCTFSYVRVIGN